MPISNDDAVRLGGNAAGRLIPLAVRWEHHVDPAAVARAVLEAAEDLPRGRWLSINLDTGQWAPDSSPIVHAEALRIAQAVLPGWSVEEIDQAYEAALTTDPPAPEDYDAVDELIRQARHQANYPDVHPISYKVVKDLCDALDAARIRAENWESCRDLLQAVTEALGIRNDQDPVIKAREIKAQADRAPELATRYEVD